MKILDFKPTLTIQGKSVEMPSITEMIKEVIADSAPTKELADQVFNDYMREVKQQTLILEVTDARSIRHRD